LPKRRRGVLVRACSDHLMISALAWAVQLAGHGDLEAW
jgi:hypothetical protein